MRKIIILLLLFNFQSFFGQIVIGENGTQDVSQIPVRTNYNYNYTQQIITAAEYIEAGGIAGNITGIKYTATKTIGNQFDKSNVWEVWMGPSPISYFATNDSWVAVSELTAVFNGEVTVLDNIVSVTFTTPFVWDGTSDIVIAVKEVVPGFKSPAVDYVSYTHESSKDVGIYYSNDTVMPDPAAPKGGSRIKKVPSIEITGAQNSCMAPIGLQVSKVTGNSATFSWRRISTDGFQYELRTSGEAGSGEVGLADSGNIPVGTNEKDLINLVPSTEYTLYLRMNCGGGEFSFWKKVVFDTLILGQIGDGGDNDIHLPINANYKYNYSQQIYLASEVLAALGDRNLIKKIKFRINNTDESDKYKDWKVFMGNTSKSEFEGKSPDNWVSPDNLEQVFDGEVSFPNDAGWLEIELNTAFIWDGTSNIVIAVNEYSDNSKSGIYFRKFDTSDYRALSIKTDGTNPDPLSPAAADEILKQVPQVVLEGVALTGCMSPNVVGINDVKTTSAKIKYNLLGADQPTAVKYRLSTYEAIPTNLDDSIDIPNFENGELLLEDLEIGERYYIWFITKCGDDSYSEWSNSVSFMTLEEGQIGMGENFSSSLPIKSQLAYNYSQQIYLADEVSLAIADNRYITSIKFYYKGTDETSNFKDWKVYIGNTNKVSFEGNSSVNWVPTNSMQFVFDGELEFPNSETGDWFDITLQEPFLWDGTSNLVVGIYEYSEGANLGAQFRTFKTAEKRGMLYYSSHSPMNMDALTRADDRMSYVPQIVLVSDEVPSCVTPQKLHYSGLASSTVKISFENPSDTAEAVEYYYSAFSTAPVESTIALGSVNLPQNIIEITGLTENTEYFVWFRTKCSADSYSNWSNLPVKFKTLIKGQVGSGELENEYLPLASRLEYNYSQQIYLKDELSISLGNERYIKKIKFYYKGIEDVTNFKDWKVLIANTTVNNFSETTKEYNLDPIPITDLREFFNGEVNFNNTTEGWIELELDSPFLWDGESNIVVAVNEYSPSRAPSTAKFRSFDTEFVRGLSHRTGVEIDLNNLPYKNFGYKYVPQIIFVSEPVPSCLIPLNISVNDIFKNTVTLKWESASSVTVQNYEYEVRISGNAGSGEVGRIKYGSVDNDIYSVLLDGLDHSTQYSVYVRSKCSDIDYSEWSLAKVFNTLCEYPDFSVENITVCGSGLITLQAVTDTENIKWYDSLDSTEVLAEGKTFITPVLTETKSYWVESYAGDSMSPTCVSSRQEVVVTITPSSAIELSNTDIVVCEGSDSEIVTITSGGSAYNTYSWTPAEGVTGNNTIGWTFNTTVSTEYVLSAKQVGDNENCQTAVIVNVHVNTLPLVNIIPAEDNIAVCLETVEKFEVDYDAEVIATIGDSTQKTIFHENYSAFINRTKEFKVQMIYTASELQQMGLTAGNIKSISFNIESLGDSATNNDYTVKIATTDKTEYSNVVGNDNFRKYIKEGLTTVYGPATYVHTESGWQEIVFNTPYNWDGTSNLVIEITHSGANKYKNAETYYTETTANTVLYDIGDGSADVWISNKRFNTRFRKGDNYEIKWSPAINLYTDETASIPYTEGESVAKVFYKSYTEGTNNINLTISTDKSCELVKDYTVRTISNTVASIIVEVNQFYCGETKVSDLVAVVIEGTTANWYVSENAVEPLSSDDNVTSGVYYVSQKAGNCESIRKRVRVTVNELPQTPIGDPIQELEEGALVKDIATDQTNVMWFSTEEDATNGENQLSNDEVIVAGTYYGVVKSAAGCVSSSIIVSVNIKLGVNDFDLTRLSYYPNPVKDVLTITYRDIIDSVEIYSLSGQRILFVKSTSNEVVVDMSQFMSSTYVIKISSGSTSQNIKVVKK